MTLNFLKKHGLTLLLFLISYSAYAQTSEEFGDWVLHCETAPSNNCVMSQVAKWENTGETLSQLNLYLNDQKYAEFVLPLGTKLDTPPKLYIGNTLVTSLQVTHCLQNGCYFKYPLNSESVERFLKMFSGYVMITAGNDQQLKIPLSGTGSRAAHNRFLERQSSQQ